jgi:ABC-type amino acid transport system permease subunit
MPIYRQARGRSLSTRCGADTFIAFKDTSLVLIIGIFDLLTTAKTSIIDPAWQSFSVEVYLFVSLIYFAFCFSMSRYSRRLEAQGRSRRRQDGCGQSRSCELRIADTTGTKSICTPRR